MSDKDTVGILEEVLEMWGAANRNYEYHRCPEEFAQWYERTLPELRVVPQIAECTDRFRLYFLVNARLVKERK